LYSKEELIARLQQLAHDDGLSSISRTMWLQRTGINEYHITKYFDNWNQFVASAGLTPNDPSRIPDDLLFETMHEYFIESSGVTTRTRFSREARYSADVYKRRWGRWEAVLSAFAEWARLNHPEFPYYDQLAAPDRDTTRLRERTVPRSPASRFWPSVGGRKLGPILNFRGLQHEPVNEDGVIFLFGMVAHDLGFVVEHIAAEFPDCEAKRRVSNENWERVRIEFEFDSRNFLVHGHNADNVDLIVCWIHNWRDCPVEVLELKSEIRNLAD
jgi:hypothetical protein